jgi:hypothetical protein
MGVGLALAMLLALALPVGALAQSSTTQGQTLGLLLLLGLVSRPQAVAPPPTRDASAPKDRKLRAVAEQAPADPSRVKSR